MEAVEIIVVDDASTDDTGDVARLSAKESAAPMRCVRLARRSGPAAARNEGARLANNTYVFFLDSDIVLPSESIAWIRETLAAYADRPEVIGVMGVYHETIPWRDFCSNFKNIYVCFLHETTPTVSPYLHTPMLCMRRDVFESEGGFDASLATAEDFRLGLKLGSQGYRFIVDRRIRGTHLKRLTFAGLLKEDGRRLRDLLHIQLDQARPLPAYEAHRFGRLLSVVLPLPILLLTATAVSFLSGMAAWCAAALWLTFYVCNLDFLRYAIGRKGLTFGIQSAAFIFVEMIWAQGALAYWLVRRRR
jgi:glycosyltransferase involved in cell wall biosynthesis